MFTTTRVSKLDGRDIVLDRVIDKITQYVATLPPPTEKTLTEVPVVDQGATSCCVSIAIVNMLCKQFNETNFNPLFVNNYRNLYEAVTDSGMSALEAYTFLFLYGCALRDTYSVDRVYINDHGNTEREISKIVIEQSRQYRIKAHGIIRSPDTAVEVLRIGQVHPSLFGGMVVTLPIYSDKPEFYEPPSNHNPLSRTYYHEVAVVDYKEATDSFRLQNSWGPQWADGGFTWITRDAWLRRVVEARFSTSNEELANLLHSSINHIPTYLQMTAALFDPTPTPSNLSYIHVEGEDTIAGKKRPSRYSNPLVKKAGSNHLLKRLLRL